MFDSYDPRWGDDRDRDGERTRGNRGGSERPGERDADARDVFVRQVDLPRDRDRELVRDRNRMYELDGCESRALATIGAFRVVHEEDLRASIHRDDETRRGRDEVGHLRESGLIQTIPLESRDRGVVVLTKSGRDLLEANRLDRGQEPRQAFYAGLRKPRELTHDAQVYRAFLRAEERLRAGDARIDRVVLDYELKREYQCFLQERNRGRADSDGRPDRDIEEILAWARQHELPYADDHVHFPDARIEYTDRDGRKRYEDIEVVTEHYRGARAAGAAKSGFRCYMSRGSSGGGGGRRGGRGVDPRLAEELLR